MTPCARIAALLADTPEAGKALATLEAGLAAHAADCTACQGALADAQRMIDGIASLHADYEPHPSLAAIAMRRAAKPVDEPAPKATRGYVVGGLIGVAAATVTFFATQPGTPEPAVHTPPPKTAKVSDLPATANKKAPESKQGLFVTACLGASGEVSCDIGLELETGIGDTRAFKLSDGTTLQVDQDTHLRFDADKRALTVLRGDAFLDVAHRDDLDKLIVTLPTGAVEVLGTELEVRAGQAMSVVDVVRGVVAVEGNEGEAKVKAGQTAWLRAGKKPLVKASNGSGHDWGRADRKRDEAYANLGFGSIRARRPGGSNDADKPLRLVDHLVDVRVQGAVAKTTIEESFASDEAHELEGIYRFTLPPGAQVAELSLLVDGTWEEGGFVEKDRAEKIWAGVIRQATPVAKRKEIIEYIWVPGPWRDPALLSMKTGNTFELRIFPIPARGERRVRIAYTESLPLVTGARRFVLPLPAEGSNARAERFSFGMKIGTKVAASDLRIRNYELDRKADDGQVLLAKEARAFRAKGDLVVEIPDVDAAEDLVTTAWGRSNDALGVDGYVALSMRPEIAAMDATTKPIDLVVVADTSYGMQKVRLERAAEVLSGIVAGLGSDDRVRVLACASSCRSLGGFEAASVSLGKDLGARLASLEPIGATRLTAAFDAADKAFDGSDREQRIIYLGDGVQTVGELDPARVIEGVRSEVGATRITTVGLGGETDRVVLAGLAKDHAGSFIDYASLDSVDATVAMVLARQHGEPLRDITLTLPEGLTAMAPASFGDLWPGDERLVTARTSAPRVSGEVVMRGTLGGEAVERRWKVDVAVEDNAGNAFVPRLWAERRIADLSARDDLATKNEIVELSKLHHVLSRHTSLLVLESPAMAKAFDVHATRPVADWDGNELAINGDNELVVATGATPTVDSVQPESELAQSTPAPSAEPEPARPAPKKTETKTDTIGAVDEFEPKVEGKGRVGFDDDFAKSADPLRLPRDVGMSRGGEWVAMKKVWFKEARIAEHSERDPAAERELEVRERRLDEMPESRERTIAVVRWHLRMHNVDAAEKVAKRWLDKDRMDPDALVALADIAALRGEVERSKLLLASAVEADPQRASSHLRMARLHEAAGEGAIGCEYRLSQALVSRSDANAQVEAVRCGAREARVLSGLEETLRAKVERSLEREAKRAKVSGPFRVDASWDVNADLDIFVVSPQGRVISWQGGAELSVEDVGSLAREALAFKGSDNGRWQVMVVRKDDDRERVEGALRISAHGQSRRVAFVIGDDESLVTVADIDVSAAFRWERADR